MSRIGRKKRRLRWLREYRSGRCRVRRRCERRQSSRIAVEATRFGAVNHERLSGCDGGRGVPEARRNGAVVHPRAQSGQGRRGAGRGLGERRMERWCAGAVDALGVAGGEMGEDSLDEYSGVGPEGPYRHHTTRRSAMRGCEREVGPAPAAVSRKGSRSNVRYPAQTDTPGVIHSSRTGRPRRAPNSRQRLCSSSRSTWHWRKCRTPEVACSKPLRACITR